MTTFGIVYLMFIFYQLFLSHFPLVHIFEDTLITPNTLPLIWLIPFNIIDQFFVSDVDPGFVFHATKSTNSITWLCFDHSINLLEAAYLQPSM